MACLLNRAPGDRAGHSNATFVPCYRWQCKYCGWDEDEHAKRIKRKLKVNAEGLRYLPITHNRERGW